MPSTAQENKEKVLLALQKVRSRILQAAASLTDHQRDEVFLGVWSIRDLLAHLVGWDVANIEGIEAILAGRLPAFYAHYDRDWQTFNAGLVAEHRGEDWDELLRSVERSHSRLVAVARQVAPAEFFKDRGLRRERYRVTIGRILQAEANDEERHLAQIVGFMEGSGSADP